MSTTVKAEEVQYRVAGYDPVPWYSDAERIATRLADQYRNTAIYIDCSFDGKLWQRSGLILRTEFGYLRWTDGGDPIALPF